MDENASQSHMLKFVLDHGSGAISASRRGTLSIPGRHIVQTPHYVPATSRGIVPHIAQDLMEKRTSVLGVYMGLEDCELETQSFPCSSLVNVLLNGAASHREIVSACEAPSYQECCSECNSYP